MNKANRILIGAFLILFIGFLINYNGNLITGGFSKDITGYVVDIPPGFSGTEIEITSCEQSISGGYLMGGCGFAYDDNVNTGFGVEKAKSVSVQFNFDKNYVQKIYFYPGPWVIDPTFGLSVSDGSVYTIWHEGFTYISDGWYEFLIDKPNIEWVHFIWTVEEHDTGLNEIIIEEKICSDTDANFYYPNGKNFYEQGTVTFGTEVNTDYCLSNRLYEYYCETEHKGNLESHICENGCENGACISVEPPPEDEPPPERTCRYYDGDENGCAAQNTIPLSACEGKIKTSCDADIDCVWYAEVSKCRPVTKCVWTHEHCCKDKEKWTGTECWPLTQTEGELCFSFFGPGKAIPGKSVDFDKKEVCLNIGSMAYGFWTTVHIF